MLAYVSQVTPGHSRSDRTSGVNWSKFLQARHLTCRPVNTNNTLNGTESTDVNKWWSPIGRRPFMVSFTATSPNEI